MGYFAPTFLAFLLNSSGVYIFHDASQPGTEPLVSCLIFLFAVFLLLWDVRLFPSSLRKLWRSGSYFFQFFLAAFLMEHIMNDFWFPLESSMIVFLPKIAQFEEEVLTQSGMPVPGVMQFLKSDFTHVVFSYTLSFFFLCCVLHATRIIDFRLLKCGFGVFLDDIKYRAKRASKRIKRLLFRPRNIKIQLKADKRASSHCGETECPLRKYLMEESDFDDEHSPRRHRRCRF